MLLAAAAGAQFVSAGEVGSQATGISPDGVWVVGHLPASNTSWHWQAGSGPLMPHVLKSPGHPFDNPVRISNLGPNSMSGCLVSSEGFFVGAAWTGIGIITFKGFGPTSPYVSQVRGLSADGWTCAGSSPTATGYQSFRWSAFGSYVVLAPQPGSISNQAYDVSADGAWVVGAEFDGALHRAAVWDASGGVTFLPQGSVVDARAYGVNHDGSVVIGSTDGRAARWTQAGGLELLSDLRVSVALGTSDDGQTIVGARHLHPDQGQVFQVPPLDEMLSDWSAGIWRPGMGWRPLKEVVEALGLAVPPPFETLNHACAISADGRRVAGTGTRGAFVVTLPAWAETYCTAQPNSQGCTPHIATSGTASATSGAGFQVSTSQLIPGTNGLLLYGVDGATATPFGGGTLCVASPRRTAVQDAGGSAACSGALDLDFNAFVAAGSDSALTVGTQVWAQYWSRDPLGVPPATTNLTDAVTFRLMP